MMMLLLLLLLNTFVVVAVVAAAVVVVALCLPALHSRLFAKILSYVQNRYGKGLAARCDTRDNRTR